MSASPTAAPHIIDGRAKPAAADHRGGTGTDRIGPNAVTRIAEAVAAFDSAAAANRLFGAASLQHHIQAPPTSMVDERDVVALHQTLRTDLGSARARSVSWLAGRRTADYLLAQRIPQTAQGILKAAPSGLASRMLLAAIGKHAWTFCGSGEFIAKAGHPAFFTIEDCPICRGASGQGPLCEYYAATFERLYAVLVHPDARVVETSCSAMGAAACTFQITWR